MMAPGISTELRVEVVGDDTELLSGVGICGGDAAGNSGNGGVVVVGAIEHEIIVAVALTIHGEAAVIVGGGDYAGREQGELVGITENEWKIVDLLGVDDGRDLEAVGLDGERRYFPRRRWWWPAPARGEREFQGKGGGYVEGDMGEGLVLKAPGRRQSRCRRRGVKRGG